MFPRFLQVFQKEGSLERLEMEGTPRSIPGCLRCERIWQPTASFLPGPPRRSHGCLAEAQAVLGPHLAPESTSNPPGRWGGRNLGLSFLKGTPVLVALKGNQKGEKKRLGVGRGSPTKTRTHTNRGTPRDGLGFPFGLPLN